MSERDFPEDFADDNGNYQNRCVYCNQLFLGHKRRVVCKVCMSGRTLVCTRPRLPDGTLGEETCIGELAGPVTFTPDVPEGPSQVQPREIACADWFGELRIPDVKLAIKPDDHPGGEVH